MPLDTPAYVIVGGGRWAGIMREVLEKKQRTVRCITGTRRAPEESAYRYRERMSEALADGQIAWICVPPCAEVPLLIEAAIESGLHAVVEKPWMLSRSATAPLARLAESHGVVVGVHFQYCFLDAVRELASAGTKWLRFSGAFTLSRADRLHLPAIHNLGSHLLAIREYVAPASELAEIRCGYEMGDERWIGLEAASNFRRSVQLATDEPIIERYIVAFEDSTEAGRFSFDLPFAARVFSACEGYAVSVSGNV